MDASAPKNSTSLNMTSPRTPEPRKVAQFMAQAQAQNVIKSDEKQDEVQIETSEISSKFKFFETFKPEEKQRKQFRITPPREGVVPEPSSDQEVYHDPDVVRGGKEVDDPEVAIQSHTATKVLSIFKQLEESKARETNQGLKPLKRFTPPLDDGRRIANNYDSDNVTNSEDEDDEDYDDEEDSEEVDSEEEHRPNGNYGDKFDDEFLKQAQSAERAKQLRAKFEKWESNEIKREQNNSSINLYEDADDSQIESAKSIRARFESMRNSDSAKQSRDKIRVNRFIVSSLIYIKNSLHAYFNFILIFPVIDHPIKSQL